EKLSGVTFSTPITSVRLPRISFRDGNFSVNFLRRIISRRLRVCGRFAFATGQEPVFLNRGRNRGWVCRPERPGPSSSPLRISWQGCVLCLLPGTRNPQTCLRAVGFAPQGFSERPSGPRPARALLLPRARAPRRTRGPLPALPGSKDRLREGFRFASPWRYSTPFVGHRHVSPSLPPEAAETEKGRTLLRPFGRSVKVGLCLGRIFSSSEAWSGTKFGTDHLRVRAGRSLGRRGR